MLIDLFTIKLCTFRNKVWLCFQFTLESDINMRWLGLGVRHCSLGKYGNTNVCCREKNWFIMLE